MRQTVKVARNASRAAVLVVAGCLCAGSAFANGGDFFQEFADQMAEGSMDIGPAYFGFVRDTRGRTIQGAAVTATITTSGSAMTVRTNVLGHYRVPGFNKDIDPATVEISCAAPGYVQLTAQRRTQRHDANTPVETDCVLTTQTAEAS